MTAPTTLTVHGYTENGVQVTTSVLLENPCRECKGGGVVYSDAWREWNEKYTAAETSARERDALQQEHGKWLDPRLRELEEQMESLGPEEIACGECDGAGTIPTREGRELLAFVRRHEERSV